MATCTHSMQRTWWPVASTTSVTGSYWRIWETTGWLSCVVTAMWCRSFINWYAVIWTGWNICTLFTRTSCDIPKQSERGAYFQHGWHCLSYLSCLPGYHDAVSLETIQFNLRLIHWPLDKNHKTSIRFFLLKSYYIIIQFTGVFMRHQASIV